MWNDLPDDRNLAYMCSHHVDSTLQAGSNKLIRLCFEFSRYFWLILKSSNQNLK